MEIKKIEVTLNGVADIMFDRFFDHSKNERPPEQKLYLSEKNVVVMPAENIRAFLFGENPGGCAKTFEGKKSKNYIRTGLGHIFIDPVLIPFKNKNKNIVFKNFDNGLFWVHESAPRTKSGSLSIKQEMKKRPVLRMPWELDFKLSLIKNPLIDETRLYNWFNSGGLLISLGTYRPLFGRFEIKNWKD